MQVKPPTATTLTKGLSKTKTNLKAVSLDHVAANLTELPQ